MVASAIDDKTLYQLLLSNQFLSEKDLKAAQLLSVRKKIDLQEALLEKDLISDENLGKIIADQMGMPFIALSKVAIPAEVLHIIPSQVALRHQAIIFGKDKEGVKVATANPKNKDFLGMISKKTGQKTVTFYTTPRDIKNTLSLYKKEIQKTFSELLNFPADAPVSEMVDNLVEYAYESKSSDIHIEPEEDGSLIRFRIDGILHDILKLPRSLHDQLITRIKVLSKLRTDEHLSAQDGKLQVKLEEEEVDVRVSIVPIVEGEKVVLRLLTSKYRQFGLTDLGMGAQDLEKVKQGFEKPFGMILSTGPTGSGKTTTIYAILKILNTREKNIATIEDPVEYDIEGINQIQVNPKTNLTFAEGLRSILRQDPDIIYVGEIRDEETADIAINSAMTGHLVLSTLHTNDAATALPRLIDMGVEPFLVASTVNIIIGQRLVRKICDKCRVSYTKSAEEVSKNFSPGLIKKYFSRSAEIRMFKGKGCAVCHTTGFMGRVGIFEVLEVSQAVKELITQKADSDVISGKGIKEGMTSMEDDGFRKVQLGITTAEEVLRVTRET